MEKIEMIKHLLSCWEGQQKIQEEENQFNLTEALIREGISRNLAPAYTYKLLNPYRRTQII